MSKISRRSVIVGAAAFASALAAGPIDPADAQPVFAGPSSTFSSVSVDVSPLRAKGLGEFAEFLGAELLQASRAALANRIARGGPRLVVRLNSLSLSSYAGGSDDDLSFGGGTNDYLEGEALVLGRSGEVLARYPQLLALPSFSGGAWYLPDNERRRAVALARNFAAWLSRTIG